MYPCTTSKICGCAFSILRVTANNHGGCQEGNQTLPCSGKYPLQCVLSLDSRKGIQPQEHVYKHGLESWHQLCLHFETTTQGKKNPHWISDSNWKNLRKEILEDPYWTVSMFLGWYIRKSPICSALRYLSWTGSHSSVYSYSSGLDSLKYPLGSKDHRKGEDRTVERT